MNAGEINGMLLLIVAVIAGVCAIRQWLAAGVLTMALAGLVAMGARGAIHEVAAAVLLVGGGLFMAVHHGLEVLDRIAGRLEQADRVATHFASKIPAPAVDEAAAHDETDAAAEQARVAARVRSRRHS